MTGTATVSVYPLPFAYSVTGGGSYCPGGAGAHVGLNNSASGVNYELFVGGSSSGISLAGNGFSLDFGLQTTAGVYTIVATNATTTCSNNMSGAASVHINALPAVHTVTGGGAYCAGGAGAHVGLDGSNTGIYYQLYNGATSTGVTMVGSGAAIDFGPQTVPGAYTIVATDATAGCTNFMSGAANISTNPAPVSYPVSGGGSYCAGGSGVHIVLGSSDNTVSYQLYNGAVATGAPVSGTGTMIDFGAQTAAGTYMVVGTNAATGCSNGMTGSGTVIVNPLPATYAVTGGGGFCAGGAGVHVGIGGSNTGDNYQLYQGGLAVGPARAGAAGLPIDFGVFTTPGSYTIVATTASTGCARNMAGSAAIAVNPLPAVYTVSGSGSSYCAGGAGIDLSLSGSENGVSYQLYNAGLAAGAPVSGNGAVIDLGYRTAAGAYTVAARNTSTGCTNNMAGTASIIVNPLPGTYSLTGGGSFCNGGTGVPVGLSSSEPGISYQLYTGGAATGSAISGTGAPISFGVQTLPGTYTVVATNAATACSRNMAGASVISVNTLPVAYSLTGGGHYCAGGTGVHVGMAGTASGIYYQLFNGTTSSGSAVPGTGVAIDFGAQTGAGVYSVVATNAATGCTSNMAGTVTVSIDALPAAYSLTGGGSYCAGGPGVHLGLSGSGAGVSYQLINGSTLTGATVAGSGSSLDFGLHTAAGTYTVKATDVATGCSANMPGSVSVSVSALPVVYPVTGGGHYCEGGSGMHVGLGNSTAGINYTLYNGVINVGTVPGTGAALDFGSMTAAGTYSVLASASLSGCAANMSGSATVAVDPSAVPYVSVSTGTSASVCAGSSVTFTANAVNGGSAPAYEWTVNGVAASINNTYTYIPLNGDVIGVTLTSNAHCAAPATATSSATMTVLASEAPVVSVIADPGSDVCKGSTVTFTASSNYGGTAPAYVWTKNGVNAGTSPTFSYMPADGDVVTCVLTSNYSCRLANTATSTPVTMQVEVPTAPAVTISANPGNSLAQGETVTMTATVSHGGPAPTYQWLVNGTAIPGATMQNYTSSSLADKDVVSCQVLSSGTCSGLPGSSSITVDVSNVGVKPVLAAGDNIVLAPNPGKGIFTITGTLSNGNEEVTAEVSDMLGKVIYTSKIVPQNGVINETMQLNSVANGTYILNLRSASANRVFHFVIEK